MKSGLQRESQASVEVENYNFVKPEDKTFLTTGENQEGVTKSQYGITAIQETIREEENTPMNKTSVQ